MLAASIQTAGMACILVASLFSLLAGDRWVRYATIASLLALLASLLLQSRAEGFQLKVFVVDLVFLAALLGVAIIGQRIWANVAASFQILVIATHVAFLLQSFPRSVYLTVLAMWAYLIVAAISAGAALTLNERLSRHEGI